MDQGEGDAAEGAAEADLVDEESPLDPAEPIEETSPLDRPEPVDEADWLEQHLPVEGDDEDYPWSE